MILGAWYCSPPPHPTFRGRFCDKCEKCLNNELIFSTGESLMTASTKLISRDQTGNFTFIRLMSWTFLKKPALQRKRLPPWQEIQRNDVFPKRAGALLKTTISTQLITNLVLCPQEPVLEVNHFILSFESDFVPFNISCSFREEYARISMSGLLILWSNFLPRVKRDQLYINKGFISTRKNEKIYQIIWFL